MRFSIELEARIDILVFCSLFICFTYSLYLFWIVIENFDKFHNVNKELFDKLLELNLINIFRFISSLLFLLLRISILLLKLNVSSKELKFSLKIKISRLIRLTMLIAYMQSIENIIDFWQKIKIKSRIIIVVFNWLILLNFEIL